MIKSNELRIGNWVRDKEVGFKDDFQVSVGDLVAIAKGCQYHSIPLTPEILKAVSFKKLPGTSSVYRIIIDGIEISVNVDLSFAYIDTEWGQASIKKPLFKYLHQLQNLTFALTGEELNYKPLKL